MNLTVPRITDEGENWQGQLLERKSGVDFSMSKRPNTRRSLCSILLTKTEDGDSWADAAVAMLAKMSKRDLIENAPVMALEIGELTFRIRMGHAAVQGSHVTQSCACNTNPFGCFPNGATCVLGVYPKTRCSP